VAIASSEVEVGYPFKLKNSQTKVLEQVIKILIDNGKRAEVNTVAELLLEYSDLEPEMRENIIKQTALEGEGWRRTLDLYIENQKPFVLIYKKATGEIETFHIRYAEIQFQEKRFYLQAWCEEDNPQSDFPELQHNRCFRLDRILNILNYSSTWKKEGLDFIQVYLHFQGDLAKAYEQKLEDLEISQEEHYLKVIKKVTNPFWTIRELLGYRKKCYIVSPKSFQEKYLETVQEILEQYQ
jgi:WYL domain